MPSPKHILSVIVIAQLCCTSLWFAGNGVMNELTSAFQLNSNALGYLTSTVQIGFIIGTLLFAITSIADRFSPSKVFFICAVLGALSNLCVIWEENTFKSILVFRFLTGFFLAGIYPVGMKIASDYYDKGLGKSLGYLVGALVVGTALPHLLKDLKGDLPWEYVLISTSTLATIGGLLMVLLVPDGPYRLKSQKLDLTALFKIFRFPEFRRAALGYFGHMWELYAFWAFVPVILTMYQSSNADFSYSIPLWSFLIIAIGGFACVIGGYLSERLGVKNVATYALVASGICCLLSPLVFMYASPVMLILFLLFWGMVVITDSPLFSTLVAQNAPKELKGTALTIVNSIGFFITIISIQLMDYLSTVSDSYLIFMVLGLGPLLGVVVLLQHSKLKSKRV